MGRPRRRECMESAADWDVIVVGAGLAGLCAAATARQAGSRVVVLEAHGPGGRARTVERDGFVLNMGAHALYRHGAGIRVLAKLGVVPTGAAPPLGRYRALAGGRLHALPTGPGSLFRTGVVGSRSKAQLARLLGTLPRRRTDNLGFLSATEWLARRKLRPDAESVVSALLRLSTYASDFDQLSADAAVSQLQIAASGGVLYLHGGWAQLVDALSATLEVRTGVEASGLDRAAGRLEVRTGQGSLTARRVVVAAGGPSAVRRVLPGDPGWNELGPPVTAACLDLGIRRIPDPGYILSLDDPVYATVQSPPAHQAPDGQAVVAAIRYGARGADHDRQELERLVARAGVGPDDIVTRRFLAHMTVSGAMPRPASGGLSGRPRVVDSGVPGVTVAGDWVGPHGLLADAALASGHAAGLLSGQDRPDSSIVVA
jgi:2-polyprenyl-6-methoxyphenol hydroxylase-like FAD-dependent oxidoreductase